MNWHETIEYIRTKPEYDWLVKNAYFDSDLKTNVDNFIHSEEFEETIKIINNLFAEKTPKILDVGSGNGISAIAFALKGFDVVSIEPDPSDTIGVGAINFLINHYQLKNIEVFQNTAEEVTFDNAVFDIVYVRQALHHAHDLDKFVSQTTKYLKEGGYYFSVRDHVIYNEKDKQLFLESHPLHKYYGGENAFTLEQYLGALNKSTLEIISVLHHFDSVINFAPLTIKEKEGLILKRETEIKTALKNKIGALSKFTFIRTLATKYFEFKYGKVYDETRLPGRLCSIISRKKTT